MQCPCRRHHHCPRLTVNAVSLSQLSGHYHPSEQIIVTQTRTNKTHDGEQRNTHLENKDDARTKSNVVAHDTRVKLNDELWTGEHKRCFILLLKQKPRVQFQCLLLDFFWLFNYWKHSTGSFFVLLIYPLFNQEGPIKIKCLFLQGNLVQTVM